MSEFKICNKCMVNKNFDSFHNHKTRSDGKKTICKECEFQRVKKYREENRDHVRNLQKTKNERNNKKNDPEYHKKYREMYPKKFKAKVMIQNAIKDKRMKRETICSKCGSDYCIHAHHDDYNYPLSVRWLCALCHNNWHIENGPGANGI